MKPFLYLMENAGLKLISHFPEVTVNMELITHSWLTVGRRLMTPYLRLRWIVGEIFRIHLNDIRADHQAREVVGPL